MPDNVGYTPGTGATISADEILGILFQRIKLTLGADGVNDGDVSSSNPMPIAAYGELIEAIEAMRMAIVSLQKSIGMAQVNPLTGRLLVDPSGVTSPISGTITALCVNVLEALNGFDTLDMNNPDYLSGYVGIANNLETAGIISFATKQILLSLIVQTFITIYGQSWAQLNNTQVDARSVGIERGAIA